MSVPDTARTFRLPDLGEGLTEAEIVSWRVSPGDDIGVDDIVVDVETAKATVEVPCPHAGTVIELHGRPGDVVQVGAPLVTVQPSDLGPAEPAGDPGADAAIADDAAAAASAEPAESGAVLVGFGTGRTTTRRRSRTATLSRPADGDGVAPRVISPVVRRLARERGVDIQRLRGTGKAGVIVRRDVETALASAGAVVPTQGRDQREVLRGVRRKGAEKLARSRREIPDASTWVDVDATELVRARDTLRGAAPDQPVGLLALLARITVAALARFPDLNTSVESDGDDLVIVRHSDINLGFAAQTDRGLVVPVVHHAGSMSTRELAAELARLTALARDGRLAPADLTGGTFTLNNYGVFGVDGSTPIINHPEAALLGIGRIVDKPWVVNGTLAVRKVSQLSLTFDHRVCDGGVAGGFLRYVADLVESPVGLLLDL